MKYLITGGSGFIGTNLIARLLREKKEVIVLDKIKPFYNAQFIQCDLTDSNRTKVAINSLDKNEDYVLFHLAGLFEKDFAYNFSCYSEARD